MNVAKCDRAPLPQLVMASLLCGGIIVVYVLSYAPVYRVEMVRQNSPTPLGVWRSAYAPVDWLIDNTFLREPLLRWSELWNVRAFLESDSHGRKLWHETHRN